jgi:lambda family phage minor tail protein L
VTTPNTGTNNALVTDLQGQAQASAYLTVFEIELPDSNIGGAGEDKLYFHDGQNGTSDITWYSLVNESDFGSSTASHYNQRPYLALPIESEGWEIRGSGTGSLPRPTIRLGNINQFFNAYLADWDDLVGAKVIRRRTLQKYLTTNPPVEFNRDIFYIERKSSETVGVVEFELVSAFDVEGISLPRRSILAARCPWKYKDTTQGGCNWSADSRLVEGSAADPLYFDKDDNIITKDVTSPSALEYTFWGRQDVVANRQANLYLNNTSYTVGNYVEFERPVGSLYRVLELSYTSNITTLKLATSAIAGTFAAGEFIVIKGISTTNANHKSVPLYVLGSSGTNITVQTDGSHSATVGASVSAGSFVVGTSYIISSAGNTVFTDIGAPNNTVGTVFTATGTGSGTGTVHTTIGYIQVCRNTLYKCKVAHTILSTDSIDDLIKPSNISYWDFGDICGKRLSSCSKRFAHIDTGVVDTVHIKTSTGAAGTGALQGGSGYANGVATAIVTIGDPTGTPAVTATATAKVEGGTIISFAMVTKGSGYEANPTVTIGGTGSGAVAEARVKYQTTDNVALPFGGFPGASFG